MTASHTFSPDAGRGISDGRPDESSAATRRRFLQRAAAIGLGAYVLPGSATLAADGSQPPESLAAELYGTLSDAQRRAICLPAGHERRSRIHPNWDITEHAIGSDFYTVEQRGLVADVLRGLTTDDGHDRLMRQMDDDSGGWDTYTIALFGRPGDERFQLALTGRHLTLRADGNRGDRVAFGGPLVYGHGAEGDPADNLFYPQTVQANRVFESLDADQRLQALRRKPPGERQVAIQGEGGRFPGIAVADLADDQRAVFEQTLATLLAPYREEDAAELRRIVDATGGIEALRMAFYRQGDLGGDRVWDIWRIEGPSLVWHFRGAPHVHAFVNVAAKV